jgi:PAT family beta-lactamase induction signal transducer AmpG
LQDVATDALAVDLLRDSERGRVNGMMWGSKLFGIAFGGAGMATVIAHSDLQTAVLLQSGIVLAVLAVVIAWRERPGEKLLPWTPGVASSTATATSFGPVITLRELKRALSTRTTFALLLVATTYTVTEGLYDPMTVELFGGFLCDRFGRRRIARIGLVMMAATLLTFGLTVESWSGPGYPHVLLLPAFKGSVAFMTVSMFSLFMKVSWTRAAATQFTAYMSLGNLGYAFGAKLNTWVDLTGLPLDIADLYVLGGLLPVIPLLLLGGLDPDGVVARKRAEQGLAPGLAAG